MRILSKWLCCFNSIPYELQWKGDIECYDKVMELHPNYPKIWYNLVLGYIQKIREYFHLSK
jgi:hypothetical protein